MCSLVAITPQVGKRPLRTDFNLERQAHAQGVASRRVHVLLQRANREGHQMEVREPPQLSSGQRLHSLLEHRPTMQVHPQGEAAPLLQLVA